MQLDLWVVLKKCSFCFFLNEEEVGVWEVFWSFCNCEEWLFAAELFKCCFCIYTIYNPLLLLIVLLAFAGNELIIFLADQKEPYFKPRVKLPMK